jgi:hypothetical protein
MVEELLAGYSAEVRAVAEAARGLVREVLPGATEQVDMPARLIGYGTGPRMRDLVCTIMPQRGWVNLGFYRGTALPDPAGLLTGTGKVHRHVKLRTPADVADPALRALLEAAVAAKI